jgi:hypothetical protein
VSVPGLDVADLTFHREIAPFTPIPDPSPIEEEGST